MPDISIRPFQRRDRDQVTALANAHLAAVLPGLIVSANALLAQFEREPDEYVVDPWVAERACWSPRQRTTCSPRPYWSATAPRTPVGPGLPWRRRDPLAALLPESDGPGRRHPAAARLPGRVPPLAGPREFANGALPAPGAYGVPDVWPHIRPCSPEPDSLTAGARRCSPSGSPNCRESVPRRGRRLRIARSVAALGTRFAALGPRPESGYCDVDSMLGEPGRFAAGQRLADIGNLWVEPEFRRRGDGPLAAGHGRGLAGSGRRTHPAELPGPSSFRGAGVPGAVGFTPMLTTTRGLQRRIGPDQTLARPG